MCVCLPVLLPAHSRPLSRQLAHDHRTMHARTTSAHPLCRSLPFLDAIAQLMLPITSVVLIVFFVAFECVLNACAEMTYFADR